jgi:hypothetical protein
MTGASSRHIANLKQSILETFDIYIITGKVKRVASTITLFLSIKPHLHILLLAKIKISSSQRYRLSEQGTITEGKGSVQLTSSLR